MSMTIEQVNAAIAEFDERCEIEDGFYYLRVDDEGAIRDAHIDIDAPPYASDIALLWPVVEQIQATSAAMDLPHKVNGEWVCFVAPPVCTEDTEPDDVGRIAAPTATEALARAVAFVAGEMRTET